MVNGGQFFLKVECQDILCMRMCNCFLQYIHSWTMMIAVAEIKMCWLNVATSGFIINHIMRTMHAMITMGETMSARINENFFINILTDRFLGHLVFCVVKNY